MAKGILCQILPLSINIQDSHETQDKVSISHDSNVGQIDKGETDYQPT